MRVRNPSLPLGQLIGFDRRVYNGDAFGVFEVPSDFGNWLCGTPGWEPEAGASLGSISTKPAPEPKVESPPPPPPPPPPGVPEKDEVIRADTQEPQTLNKRPPPPPPPPPPSTEPEKPAEEGPNLDAMTKAELLACADKYRDLGYVIEIPQNALKEDVKHILAKALYGEE